MTSTAPSTVPAALYPKLLELIILPTEKCNFRCTYCYETFEVGKMKRSTIDAIKKLIQARADRKTLDVLSLSWFGGEPLLAKEVIFEISRYAHDLHRNGVIPNFGGSLTTNGYLLDTETLTTLVGLRQGSFQISLDGFGKGHDATRRYASGAGTFDVIWKNLLAAKKTDLEFAITLRLHMTRENEESQNELVDQICSEFGGDKRFNVFFKPIENLGGPNAKQLKTLGHSSARERLIGLQEKLKSACLETSAVIDGPESATGSKAITVGAGSQLQSAEKSADERAGNPLRSYSGYICYAAKPNSLMIRANGTIGKCTVMLDDPRNKVGVLNPDGTVTLDSQLISSMWMRGFMSQEARELECPAQNLPRMPVEAPVSLESLRAGLSRKTEKAATEATG